MRLVRLVIPVAALLIAGAAQAQPRAKFILDWAFQGQQSTWTLAQDKGYFKAAGAEITVDRGYGSGDTIAKVASGAWDIGLADLYVLLRLDRKSTRLNSSHLVISYAVFCLKK